MSKRKTRDFDDELQIDLEELTGAIRKPKPTAEQKRAMKAAAEQSSFSSREPKKRRKISPYTAQFGGKCREGMKTLFQDIGGRMGGYDTQTLELAILALLEKEQFEDLKRRYEELVK